MPSLYSRLYRPCCSMVLRATRDHTAKSYAGYLFLSILSFAESKVWNECADVILNMVQKVPPSVSFDSWGNHLGSGDRRRQTTRIVTNTTEEEP